MPPFRLEVFKENPKDRLVRRMLHCKKEYHEMVKITDWEKYLESQPTDINPYDPNCFRLHNSHYYRLGSQDQETVTSETHDAFKIHSTRPKRLSETPSSLINFLTFHDDSCEYLKSKCPKICVDEYITTMQQSYQAPYSYEIKRLSMPIVGNQNKKMASNNECKFLDDNFRSFSKTLHQNKGIRHMSYNPFTGDYTKIHK